jgi:threonine dehydrogenase-like Zn-dependent dehydrogenase
MKTLALTGAQRFRVQDIPRPALRSRDVLLEVAAVGICGTDFHIYDGLVNYHLSPQRVPVPLAEQPQVLGHEFSGYVRAAGEEVKRVRLGDLVVADQVLNCRSQRRAEICEYCDTGDSHQCSFGQEHGITGLPGALSEFVAVPESNVVTARKATRPMDAALAEPLGCVIHAQDRADVSEARYRWEGKRRIQHVVILGAGSSGLLFLQYLRQVRKFAGEIFVLDLKAAKLQLAKKLGGTPIAADTEDVSFVIHRETRGEGVQYLIEATGNGKAFDWIGKIARRQATFSLYGGGHGDLAPGCLTPLQAMEFSVVTSAGASGRFSCEHGPEIYRRALDLIEDRTIDVACLVSHRYERLEDVPLAFSTHRHQDDFIKGVFTPISAEPLEPNEHAA